jgi:hypothetical protein
MRLYPGPFDDAHTRLTQPTAEGLADWIDPGEFLPSWIARTAPIVDLDKALLPALDPALELVRRDAIGRAWAEAEHLSSSTSDPAVHADAEWLLERLATTPGNAMRRARAWIDAGHPTETEHGCEPERPTTQNSVMTRGLARLAIIEPCDASS